MKRGMSGRLALISITALITLVSSAGLLRAGDDAWTSIGPHGAGHFGWALAIDPVDPQILFAGMARGLYKSLDAGESWKAVRTDLLVLEIAIGSSGKTIYAGGVQDLYRSDDGGASWRELTIDATVRAIVIDPSTPRTIYIGTNQGVLQSADDGATWDEVNSGLPQMNILTLALDPSNPQTLYAGTDDGGAFVITLTDRMTAVLEENRGTDRRLAPDRLVLAAMVAMTSL